MTAKLCLILSFYLGFQLLSTSQLVFAMPANDWKLAAESEKLAPWFKTIQKRIEADSRFKDLCLSSKEPIHFVIRLKNTGEISDFKIIKSAGPAESNKIALDLLSNPTFFMAAPNDSPYKNLLEVIFDRNSKSVQFALLRRWPQTGARFS
ncbi:MAG: hypothetical protein IT342_17220 [Candidatus Melainabacteria bacterium]|nr:hypothetical protein [Candidatus Melainabacteria bacterium]